MNLITQSTWLWPDQSEFLQLLLKIGNGITLAWIKNCLKLKLARFTSHYNTKKDIVAEFFQKKYVYSEAVTKYSKVSIVINKKTNKKKTNTAMKFILKL